MNKLLLFGAILGLISVIMGALGDHAFALSSEQAESMDTAIRYNMLYAILIVVLALQPSEKKLFLAGFTFALGTSLFSFSIYAALISGIAQFTYLTPIGGITIIFGWAFLIYVALKSKKIVIL